MRSDGSIFEEFGNLNWNKISEIGLLSEAEVAIETMTMVIDKIARSNIALAPLANIRRMYLVFSLVVSNFQAFCKFRFRLFFLDKKCMDYFPNLYKRDVPYGTSTMENFLIEYF
jgi:hypothetical protein